MVQSLSTRNLKMNAFKTKCIHTEEGDQEIQVAESLVHSDGVSVRGAGGIGGRGNPSPC